MPVVESSWTIVCTYQHESFFFPGRFLNSLPGLISILVVVTFVGAFMFQKLESPNERHSRIHVSKVSDSHITES